MQVLRVSNNSLQAFIDENKADLTDQAFAERYLDTVIDSVKSNPALYRTYGAHWWPLKRLMQQRPSYPNEFGPDIDAELNAAFSYESDAMTVTAAYLEQQGNIETMMMSETRFAYDTLQGDLLEVILEDADMERLLFAAQMLSRL